jgi:hypothetical protein
LQYFLFVCCGIHALFVVLLSDFRQIMTAAAAVLALTDLFEVTTYSCAGGKYGLFSKVSENMRGVRVGGVGGSTLAASGELSLFCVASVPISTVISHAMAFALLAIKVNGQQIATKEIDNIRCNFGFNPARMQIAFAGCIFGY